MPKSEKDWEAENDARTLVEAEVIKKDSRRHMAATAAAEKLAKEAEDRAKAMQKVAKEGFYDKSPKPPEK